MNDYERDSSGQPTQSFGSAPDGEQEIGDAPRPTETMGDAPGKPPAPTPPAPPAPAPPVSQPGAAGGGRNMAWLVGGVVAILVIVAAIFGFAMR